MTGKNKKYFILLHIVLIVYSISSVCTKIASQQAFMSVGFILCYGAVLLTLMIYAFAWQIVIKHIPLTTAFANKAVTMIWGLVWGALIFHERITAGKVVGALIVIAGVLMYVTAEDSGDENE